MMGALRKYLIAGLLVWLPLGATIVVVKLVLDLLDHTELLLPPEYRPAALLGFSIPGFGLLLSLGILVLTGMLAANLLGRRMVALWERLLGRIPLVRNIYNAVKQIAHTLLSAGSRSFRKVVMVEYPRMGVYSIGFLSNDAVSIELNGETAALVSVFIPTTPNPTSGFIILLPATSVTELNMSVEDGFKFIISMGVVIPDKPIRRGARDGAVADSQAGP